MSCGIAIFVKTPVLSPVKTRLWPDIGQRQAEALYLISAEAVASVAQQASGEIPVETYWAVAEEFAMHTDAWIDLPLLPQGTGDLGQRMDRVYRELRQRHHAAILIGADAPQLRAQELQRAAQWLCSVESRLVIGRARDGGFWLFGGNSPIAPQAWSQARYSEPDTCQHFVRAMGAFGRWAELEQLRDIDTAEDLVPVLSSLDTIPEPTAAQTRLIGWLRELTSSCACTR